jgi:tetratricopeptide (TPR) repeat protein
VLCRIYLEQKREDDALAQFQAWTRFDENSPEPLVGAARIYRERKDWAAASKSLELEVYIDPYDPDIQQWLGEAAMENGAWPVAIDAFQALIGLETSDPAGAHYSLARALLGAGRRAEAKKEVLRSLEIAPTFAKAQDLLLKLTRGAP